MGFIRFYQTSAVLSVYRGPYLKYHFGLVYIFQPKSMLPNFVVVGAAKCGTTSIYNYLKQHPEVFMPNHKDSCFLAGLENMKKIKEANFKGAIINSLEEYTESYKASEQAKAVGEVCALYLNYYIATIANIKKYLNEPKIIMILRNPVERAFSNFMMSRIHGHEKREFSEVIVGKDELGLKKYIERGLYTEQVKAYLDNFKQVKIYLYDDLQSDSAAMMQDMFAFIGVDPTFQPDMSIRHNISGAPKLKLVNSLYLNKSFKKYVYAVTGAIGLKTAVKKIATRINAKNLKKTAINESDRHYLVDYYREDVQVLQKLIQRDLSHWLK